MRKPFQGVSNIIRFNWPYFLIPLISGIVILFIQPLVDPLVATGLQVLFIASIFSTLLSLIVSTYIYDFSDFYTFSWVNTSNQDCPSQILNIHAGFDETSSVIHNKFPTLDLQVLDFYNPETHTEASIKRARKCYPSYPGTQSVSTTDISIKSNSVARIFCIFSAHEIRNDVERISFFKELDRVMCDDGEIELVEHLRDVANFLAYNIGFFHFYSKRTWLTTFHAAGLRVSKETKITPFLTSFILKKNAASS